MLPRAIASIHELEGQEGATPALTAGDEGSERLRWLHIIYRDGLTGLPNSRYCEKLLCEDSRQLLPTMGLLLVEIANYHSLQQSCGKTALDPLVLWVSSFLTNNLSSGDLCCRIADDRFAVLVPRGSRDAFALSHRLVSQLVKECPPSTLTVELRFCKARFEDGIIRPTLLTAVASPNRRFPRAVQRQTSGTV